eukprot:GEZU01025946.1.p1 GENE.GEZU01025946.1~~GEZU01025946.1.p1  ORF type:complete len:127 (-),score=12.43 GEZU01025946.1:31-411(-)
MGLLSLFKKKGFSEILEEYQTHINYCEKRIQSLQMHRGRFLPFFYKFTVLLCVVVAAALYLTKHHIAIVIASAVAHIAFLITIRKILIAYYDARIKRYEAQIVDYKEKQRKTVHAPHYFFLCTLPP